MKRYKSVIAADLLENADSGYKTYFCLHILYQTTMKKIQFITLLRLVAAVWVSCKQAPAAEAETNSFGAGVAKPDSNIFVISDHGYGKRTKVCLLYTSPSPRDRTRSRMPSSA